MRRILFFAATGLSLLALSITGQAQQISGQYVETRSADVYTGACVANGEVNLVGDQAILAWQVNQGSWQGVALNGLGVVGVVKAAATLGNPYTDPYPAKAVLIVDQKANAEQRKALVSFAQEMAGELLKNVVKIEVAPISLEISHDHGHYGKALLKAGNIAGIETRAITPKDHLCGNEETFYPPLAAMTHAMPAVAELDKYTGPGLGVSWTVSGKRSAFVGSFAR
ncbi:MAG TPA: DUF1326 domain-containing protein [Blastocatellia bacterium]|nr:DUF1326 domain-containing protein [Blastocatellia bacterium]